MMTLKEMLREAKAEMEVVDQEMGLVMEPILEIFQEVQELLPGRVEVRRHSYHFRDATIVFLHNDKYPTRKYSITVWYRAQGYRAWVNVNNVSGSSHPCEDLRAVTRMIARVIVSLYPEVEVNDGD